MQTVHEADPGRLFGDLFDIGVFQDDHRRLAAELQQNRSEVLGGGRHDVPGRGATAGENEFVPGQ